MPPPKSPEEGYHLSEDLANDAIGWLQKHKAFQPDKPFYMYWARGAIHGPHHIMKEWADKYKGNSMTDGMPTVSASSSVPRRKAGSPPMLSSRHATKPCRHGRASPKTKSPSSAA